VSPVAGQCVIESTTGPCPQPVACPGSNKLTCGDPATTCDGYCEPGLTPDTVAANELRMSQPYGATAMPSGRMAYDARGNLLFADTNNHVVRRISPTGRVTTVASTRAPVGLALGEDGTVYFTDVEDNCIRALDPTTWTVSVVVGRCGAEAGFAGDGGPATDALLAHPYGIAVSGRSMYVADSYNHRVRVVNLTRDHM